MENEMEKIYLYSRPITSIRDDSKATVPKNYKHVIEE